MAIIGLKHPVFSPIATEPNGGLPTYSTGMVIGYAIGANVSIERSDAKLYGDDKVVESEKSFLSGTITLSIDDLPTEAIKMMLGSQEKTVDGVTVIRDAGTYNAPYGGFGYCRIRVKDGVRTIRAIRYYKTQWVFPAEEAKTKGESIEWQTPTIEGEIMTVNDTEQTYRDIADFPAEADAVSWLDEFANVVEPASKTALTAAIGVASALDPEDYTSVSWVALANALTTAVAVAAMTSPSQSRVDAATAAIAAATALLVEDGA
jgi:phi13 family phage major tail protein